ncbi:MAG TPA: hypothetical protein DEP66_00445 [Acidimicrobiaceae bacterium]|nr:hypothetical protein [Acidimicrobiaceae bacterium]
MKRRRAAVLAAALLTATLLTGAAAGGTPAGAAVRPQTTNPDSGGMALLESDVGVVGSGTVRLTLQLPGVLADDDELIVNVHEPVLGETAFRETTRATALGSVLASQAASVGGLGPDQFGAVEVVLRITDSDDAAAGDAPPVRLVAPGVYPVTVELRTAAQQLVGRIVTHIVLTAAGAGRLDVVLVARIPAGPSAGDWLRTIARHADVPLLVSVEPALLEREATADAAAQLRAAAGRAGSGIRLVRDTYYPVDVAALRGAGLDAELDDLAALGAATLALHGEPAAVTLWAGHGSADARQIDARAARGVREVVLDPGSVRRVSPAGAAITAAGSTGGTVAGTDSAAGEDASPDAAAASRLRAPVEVAADENVVRALVVETLAPPRPGDTPGATAQRLLAHLAVIAGGTGAGSTGAGSTAGAGSVPVVTIDLTADGHTPAVADAFLSHLPQLPGVAPVPASTALGRPLALDAGSVPLRLYARPAPPGAATEPAAVAGYVETKRLLDAYRSMIRDDDTADHDRLAARLLATLSNDQSAEQRAATRRTVDDFVRRQAALLDATTNRSVRLTARAAQVPFSFQNNSTATLRVELRLLSEKLTVDDFDDGESTTLVLPPGVTTHEIGLRTLGSGAFVVEMELYSPDGTLLIERKPIVMQSTAPTGVGLVLAVGAAGFLAVWWLVDSRRRRRRAAQ